MRIKKSVFINLFNEIIKKFRSLCWKVWELRKKDFYTGCKKSSAYLRIIWHLIDYTVVNTMKWLKSLNVSLKCMYHFNKVKCWPLHCCFHSYPLAFDSLRNIFKHINSIILVIFTLQRSFNNNCSRKKLLLINSSPKFTQLNHDCKKSSRKQVWMNSLNGLFFYLFSFFPASNKKKRFS